MYRTRNWLVGILIAAWVASFVVGYLHSTGMLFPEPENPIIHTTRDWVIVVIFALPISYIIARLLPGRQ